MFAGARDVGMGAPQGVQFLPVILGWAVVGGRRSGDGWVLLESGAGIGVREGAGVAPWFSRSGMAVSDRGAAVRPRQAEAVLSRRGRRP